MIVIPYDGLAGPAFDTVTSDESIEAFLAFDAPLISDGFLKRLLFKGRSDHDAIGKIAAAWAQRRGVAAPICEGDSTTMRIAQRGLTDPRMLVAEVVEVVRKEFPVHTVVYMKRPVGDDGMPGLAVDDPRSEVATEVSDEDEYWAASFDLSRPAPPILDPAGMFSMMQTDHGLIAELRPALFVPDVRVSYGLMDVDDRELDARGREVARMVRQCFDTAFGGKAPPFLDREAEDWALDAIAKQGRRGYAFALRRDSLLTSMVMRYRYRENELLYALRAAVLALGLAPVVHWDRGDVFIVNLWEQLQ